jgi:hypothetical protein
MADTQVATRSEESVGRLYADLAERALWTFVQAFIGVLLAGGMLDLSTGTLRAGAIAGIAAVLALIKGVAASRIGDPGTAATLPRG